MLIQTHIIINKNTQLFHMWHRFDQLIANIKIGNIFFLRHLNDIISNLDGFASISIFFEPL